MQEVKIMAVLYQTFLFLVGGSGYVGLEFLWRGRSHISMFLAGGICFLLLGQLERARFSVFMKCLLGAVIITAVELLVGLMTNRDHQVWDYRQMPYNFLGQVCLSYSLLWIPVSFLAMLLHRLFVQKIRRAD